ncbi:hypothetical protein P280DRAFT_543392 [Massarina eburnea CBS 473.64]|uniref:Uncharacterized protein n=1 Tax=Massarina eburnea CBS 473.64 TaxID=1395130 RepID=A0A6A6S2P2_9PLEO|nr:hypothetical protein P280DRAFT_543392 [Massarina eburnea CBS 473.64]
MRASAHQGVLQIDFDTYSSEPPITRGSDSNEHVVNAYTMKFIAPAKETLVHRIRKHTKQPNNTKLNTEITDTLKLQNTRSISLYYTPSSFPTFQPTLSLTPLIQTSSLPPPNHAHQTPHHNHHPPHPPPRTHPIDLFSPLDILTNLSIYYQNPTPPHQLSLSVNKHPLSTTNPSVPRLDIGIPLHPPYNNALRIPHTTPPPPTPLSTSPSSPATAPIRASTFSAEIAFVEESYPSIHPSIHPYRVQSIIFISVCTDSTLPARTPAHSRREARDHDHEEESVGLGNVVGGRSSVSWARARALG